MAKKEGHHPEVQRECSTVEVSEGDKGMKKINPEPDKVNLLEVLEGRLAGSTEGCGPKFKVTT